MLELAPNHSMSRRALIKGAIGIVGSTGLIALVGCSSYLPEGSTSAPQFSQSLALQKINDTRRANGRDPVTWSSRLARASKNQTNLMASRGELSHSLGGSLRERVRAVGYIGAVGENLAGGQNTLEKAIAGWLQSSGHRNTLLSPRFTECGMAVSTGRAPYKTYWALIMGGDTNAWIGT